MLSPELKLKYVEYLRESCKMFRQEYDNPNLEIDDFNIRLLREKKVIEILGSEDAGKKMFEEVGNHVRYFESISPFKEAKSSKEFFELIGTLPELDREISALFCIECIIGPGILTKRRVLLNYQKFSEESLERFRKDMKDNEEKLAILFQYI